MDKWLAKANETLETCFGIGTENETKQKMEAVTVSRPKNTCVDAIKYFLQNYSFRKLYVVNVKFTDFIEPHPRR